MIQPHPLYLTLGKSEKERQHAYRELFRLHLNAALLHDVREVLNRELVLGREDFKDKIESMINRQTRPGNPGRPRVEELNGSYYLL